MPESTQTITIAGYDAASLQAIAYGALEQLNWTIKYAGEDMLVAYTRKSWKRYANEITVQTGDSQLAVTSKMIHGEAFDMMGRTKKDVASFLSSFETIKSGATNPNINEWNEKIAALKNNTLIAAEQEVKDAVEIDKVMNLSKSNLYLTYGIIAINVVVFVLMVVGGINFFAPTGIDIIKWGANYAPLTLSGDWWRLLSCVFVHIGIIHLAFNMYALYMVGVYLEPMLGKTRYIVAYICTGVFASLASLWWHKDPVPSAGASGAIFGMYGVFLALLSTNLIPKQIRNSLLQSIGVFVVYNLVYGMKSGVDNAAHIGGLLSGLVIGYLYYGGLKKEGLVSKKNLVAALISIITAVFTFFYLDNRQVSSDVRVKAENDVKSYSYKDADRFNTGYNEIIEMQNKALAPLNDRTLTDDQLAAKLDSISMPQWEKAERLFNEMKLYDISDKEKQKADVMHHYINMRKEQITLIKKLIVEKDELANAKLVKLGEEIDRTVKELDKL